MVSICSRRSTPVSFSPINRQCSSSPALRSPCGRSCGGRRSTTSSSLRSSSKDIESMTRVRCQRASRVGPAIPLTIFLSIPCGGFLRRSKLIYNPALCFSKCFNLSTDQVACRHGRKPTQADLIPATADSPSPARPVYKGTAAVLNSGFKCATATSCPLPNPAKP